MDPELQWFRLRVAKLFAISELEYVDVLINDHYDKLKEFFEEDYEAAAPGARRLESRILYLSRKFYDRLVEKEITVVEEVPHVATPEPEVTKEKRKKKRSNKGDLKDEDAEVKLDRDFLSSTDNAPTAGTTAAGTGCYCRIIEGGDVASAPPPHLPHFSHYGCILSIISFSFFPSFHVLDGLAVALNPVCVSTINYFHCITSADVNYWLVLTGNEDEGRCCSAKGLNAIFSK